MSIPDHSTPRELARPDDVATRLFGGPPLQVIFRLALLSIVVGVIMEALGFDPFNIIQSVERLVSQMWDLGFHAARFLWRYLLLGAAVVVPLWLLVRIARAPRGLGLVAEIKRELVQALGSSRNAGLPDLVGMDAAGMTAEPWPR